MHSANFPNLAAHAEDAHQDNKTFSNPCVTAGDVSLSNLIM